jgi:hypothetical protein
MRDTPEEDFPSVAGEVMRCLDVRRRRLSALRWTVAVATAAFTGIVVNAFGARVIGFAYRLVTHDFSATGELVAYNKLAAVARTLGEVITRAVLEGSLGADLGIYRAQVWALGAGALAVVVVLMYLMGLWLKQPKGGKSWHFGRLWHGIMLVR